MASTDKGLTWQDRHRAYVLEQNTTDANAINECIKKTEELGIPYPRFLIDHEKNKMLCFVLEALVEEIPFEKETGEKDEAQNSSFLILKVRQIYSLKDGSVEGPRTIRLDDRRRYIAHEIKSRWIWYNSQFSSEEAKVPLYPSRKGKMSLADREWRYNYWMRVWYGLIPQRGGTQDGQARSEARNCFGGETPTKEQKEELEAVYKERNKGTVLGHTNIDDYEISYAYDGKYYGLFLKKSGLWELVEVPKVAYLKQKLDKDEVKELLETTILPPPPSTRALPVIRKIDEEKQQRWLDRCPWYMSGWNRLLISGTKVVMEI